LPAHCDAIPHLQGLDARKEIQMAKLKAHGHEVGTVYYSTSAKRYMSDGVILKNRGEGWKIHGKVKAGIEPRTAYENAVERQNKVLAERPAFAAYRKALHNLAGLCKRWQLQAAIQLMPDDPDGVWSEACDGWRNIVSADLDEVSELCRLFRAAISEQGSKEVEAA
jgi:hypothetical protein